jgi:hypothetical protein
METPSQPAIPTTDRMRSQSASSGTPLIDIAASTTAELNHLRYQSVVYLGVALLKIRSDLSLGTAFNSSGLNSMLLFSFFSFCGVKIVPVLLSQLMR